MTEFDYGGALLPPKVRHSAFSCQRFPQRLGGLAHFGEVGLVLRVGGVQVGAAEGAILAAVDADEAAAASAESERDRDPAGLSH